VEELTASIAYLDVIVRRATDPQMLKMLLKFLLTTCSDGVSLLEQIAQRILEPSTRVSDLPCSMTLVVADFVDCLECV
jgi:hypothetical protein